MDYPLSNPQYPNDDGSCTFPFTSFPDELILEILIRLTPKSICQLKCLSKHLLSYLSSFRFISAYSSLSPQPTSWLLVDRDGRFSPDPDPNISFSSSQPPNISYLTLSGLPTRLTKPGPPTLMLSSNGLVLFSLAPPSNHLHIFNPVTLDWAPLPVPDCGKITKLPHVALSAKYTPTGDDVRLVVIELQISSKGKVTLLTYRSVTGKWESRPGNMREPSVVLNTRLGCSPDAEGSFEVNGKLFWVDSRCGLVVLDDPFGERVELRFIRLPPKVGLGSLISRSVYRVSGFVQCFDEKERDLRIWRLNDVEKGKWGVLYKVDYQKRAELRLGGLKPHPLDVDLGIMAGEDKMAVVNMRKLELVEIVSYRKNAGQKVSYFSVVLPTFPIPLPLSLRATSAKESGNIYFKNKNFKEAIVCYSRSISCQPTAAAYANRAAVNFELGKYQEAEMDCSEALKIDQHYVKVYVRRAIVRKELGMLFKAKEDVEMALKLDGQHHEVMKLYAEINCLLEMEAVKTEEDS